MFLGTFVFLGTVVFLGTFVFLGTVVFLEAFGSLVGLRPPPGVVLRRAPFGAVQ
ncbi:MAG: hypothetical protein OEY41_04660 [Acidimicrobiia bacterium]|nr:hypothetical protein [Acidimicrobiia bacterium]